MMGFGPCQFRGPANFRGYATIFTQPLHTRGAPRDRKRKYRLGIDRIGGQHNCASRTTTSTTRGQASSRRRDMSPKSRILGTTNGPWQRPRKSCRRPCAVSYAKSRPSSSNRFMPKMCQILAPTRLDPNSADPAHASRGAAHPLCKIDGKNCPTNVSASHAPWYHFGPNDAHGWSSGGVLNCVG